MTDYEKDFERLVRQSGIPLESQEFQAEWDAINKEQGSKISNDSKWSPFWQLISAIVTTPAVKLSRFLIGGLLPNVYLKTATGQYLDMFAYSRDVTRYPATRLKGTVKLVRDDATKAQTVKAGLVIQSPVINDTIYQIATVDDAVFKAGDRELNVDVEALQSGSASNLAPGYYSLFVEPVENIRVVTDASWLTTPGTDTETDGNLRQRVRNKFTAVGRWHHDAAYKSIIADFAKLPVDYIFFEHGAPRGPGTANAYIMTSSGVPAQSFVDSINNYIDESGEHGHGDDLLCYPIPMQENSLSPVVYINPMLDGDKKTQCVNVIENMIRCAFRQNSEYSETVTQTMPFKNFSFSKLAEELHANNSDLVSIEFKTSDITGGLYLPYLKGLEISEGS